MLNNILRDRKEMVLFLLMFTLFTYFAVVRVDHLEKNVVSHENNIKLVYNK